jgi:phage gpG-like protein
MRIVLQVHGAEDTARELAATGARLSQPAAPLLQAAGAMMQTFFQTHLNNAEGPGGPWPELAAETRAIRRHYGHGEAPKLIRAGDLLHSITTLGQADSAVDVGTRLSYARIVHDGGQVTDENGRTRTVQAFPFVYLLPQEIGDLMDAVTAYYFEGSPVAA